MKKLSFVIPCYCSEKSIKKVVDDIIKTVENDGRYTYEIICVNDCSKDDTYSVLVDLAHNSKVKVLNMAKNFGQHSALMAGFNEVTGDIVVCLDDDGQNPPSEMFRLIDKLEEGYDLVSARYKEKKSTLFRKIGSKVSFFMSTHLVGMPKGIELNSYCVCQRFVIDEVVKYKNAYPFVHGLMLRATRNVANVYIDHQDRATYVGVVNIFIALLCSIILIIQFAMGILLNYSLFIAINVVLFLTGELMFFVGLLGEYIGRMYICINNAPQYVIKEKINIENKEEE